MSTAELPDVVQDALSNASVSRPARKPKDAPDKQVAARKAAPAAMSADSVLIEFPLGSLDTQFPNSRVDVHLDHERSKRLRCLLVGLVTSKARLANDMPVRTNADVVRWLLDQPDLIAAAHNPSQSE